MLRIILVTAALVLPGLAAAQTASSRPGVPSAEPQRMGAAPRTAALPATDTSAAPAARPTGKTYGPDLAAVLFAPLDTILSPINDGLHAFDATVAPLNAALAPITGPVDPALFAPAPGPQVAPAK